MPRWYLRRSAIALPGWHLHGSAIAPARWHLRGASVAPARWQGVTAARKHALKQPNKGCDVPSRRGHYSIVDHCILVSSKPTPSPKEQSARHVSSLGKNRRSDQAQSRPVRSLPQCSSSASVRGRPAPQMALAEDDELIQALVLYRPHKPLRVRNTMYRTVPNGPKGSTLKRSQVYSDHRDEKLKREWKHWSPLWPFRHADSTCESPRIYCRISVIAFRTLRGESIGHLLGGR